MIGQLQRRFVIIAMIVSFMVTGIIYAFITLGNYNLIANIADSLINSIVENNGEMPEFKEKQGSVYTKETKYTTRYFYANVDSHGKITNMNMNYIASIKPEEVDSVLNSIYQLKNNKGFYDVYRYRIIPGDNGNKTVVLLDCSSSLDAFQRGTIKGVYIIEIGLLCMLILFAGFSKRVLSPIIENIEKQKQFIANAGHELKTPIAVILANAEVLEMTEENEEKLDIIKSTKSQAERLSELTGSLLNLAKAEEGKVDLNFQEFSITELIQEQINTMKTLAKGKEIVFEIEKDENIIIKGDKNSIKELIIILLDNAIKYSNVDGKIEIYAKKQGKNNCKLRFINTCEDVKKIDTKKIYERFYREDKSRNKKKDGYGIGLSMAKSIVDMHKGRIFTYITKDQKICFTVLL